MIVMFAVFRAQQCLISVAPLPRYTATAMRHMLWHCRQSSTACDVWSDTTSLSIRSCRC